MIRRNCREVLHRKLDCMWPRDENDTNEAKTKAKAAISQQGLAIKCNPGGEGQGQGPQWGLRRLRRLA